MADEKDMSFARETLRSCTDNDAYEFLKDNGMSEEDAYLSIICAKLLEKHRKNDIDKKIKDVEELEERIFYNVY